jgi:tetratricopeptide (TPR) repeat protein
MKRLQIPGEWARIDAPRAERELAALRKALTPPWDLNLPFAELVVYYELEDATKAEQAVAAVEQLAQRNNMNAVRSTVLFGRGRVAELRGDCNQGVKFYQESAALEVTDVGIHAHIGRCLRKLRNFKEAQTALSKVLTVMPAHGSANLEMGLLFHAAGDAAKARTYLQRALQTWQTADPNYQPSRQAREALAALG